MTARVLTVILNYRTADLALRCLDSLAPELDGSFSVVVADNDSQDGSAAKIAQGIQDKGYAGWAKLMALPKNGGFAYGNNAPVRAAWERGERPDYVHLLNPDTEVRPGAIRALVSFMDQNPRVGIAGSRLEDPDGTPQRSAFRFPTWTSELETYAKTGPISRALDRYIVAPPVPEQAVRTDWVAGASMIIRRAVIDAIGLMDEAYFLYFEETDYCLAASRAGWPTWYVPESRVMHLVGAATELSDARRHRRRRPTYWFDSRRRYFMKNFGSTASVLADASLVLGASIHRARAAVARQDSQDPPHFIRDLLLHAAGRTKPKT
ncbi:MAG: glycosyltransferase family 2 protein [Myxococcota bacterium]